MQIFDDGFIDNKRILQINFLYSSLRPFLCFTTNQFAQKLKFLANLITYLVNICNIYFKSKIIKKICLVVNATISKGAVRKGEEKVINGVSVCSRLSWLIPRNLKKCMPCMIVTTFILVSQ